MPNNEETKSDRTFRKTIIAMLIGAFISTATSYTVQRMNAKSAHDLQTRDLKAALYDDFLSRYGDVTIVGKMGPREWFSLNTIRFRLQMFDDADVYESVTKFYTVISRFRNQASKSGEQNKILDICSQERKTYYESLSLITKSMAKSIGSSYLEIATKENSSCKNNK